MAQVDTTSEASFNSTVVFYGLVSWDTNSVVDFYASREEAEAERADAVADEPGWESLLSVMAIDFSGEHAAVLPSWRAG